MSDYIDGQNVLLKRPEPGRHIKSKPRVQGQKQKTEIKIDTDAIANAVIKAISNKMPLANNAQNQTPDNFDNSASLTQLAEAMINSKESEGKIEGIGIIKETKKDIKETKKTIDLLSKLD